jgi:hypothetical protein
MNPVIHKIRIFRATLRFLWKYMTEEKRNSAMVVLYEGYKIERGLGYL